MISVAHEEGDLNDLRAILGNDVAIKAYREGRLPFPDGTIIARLAWSYDPSEENNKAFGRSQSFVAGAPKNGVQFMVKDSKKYASTGGWGFAHFNDGKSADKAVLKTCFPCHEAVNARLRLHSVRALRPAMCSAAADAGPAAVLPPVKSHRRRAFEWPAGPHSLAAAAHRQRSAGGRA